MIKRKKNGFVELVNKKSINYFCRQHAPPIFNMTTVAYVAKPEYILKSKGIFDGKVKSLNIPKERAVDIDNEFDFKIANYLIKSK